MPLSTTDIDINRATSGVALPSEVSNLVLQNVQENSAIMQLAQRMVIPGSGVTMNVITGDPEPAWVDETNEKTVDTPTFANKKMVPYKLAVIVPFSDQFRRDVPALYDAIVARVPLALAKKFDATAFHGTAPGSNFDVLSGCDAVDIEADTYNALVTAKTGIAIAGGNANGWVFAPQAESILLGAVDGSDRPLFINNLNTEGNVAEILGTPAYYEQAAYKAGSSAANTIGFVGDWSKAVYGIVQDITVEYSNQATINDGTNQINLWQRNMFALRCEMEVGFVVQDTDYFKRLTDTYPEA